MDADSQKRLFKKYPKLFADLGKPITETAISWGCECGDGWLDLIDMTLHSIQTYVDNSPVTQPVLTQIKEKYGSLYIYLCPTDETIDSIVKSAEELSTKTCEVCGNHGKLNCLDKDGNLIKSGLWIKTRCQEHEFD